MSKTVTISQAEIDRQLDIIATLHRMIAGSGQKFCIQTYGCQQNEADSERLAGMASDMGYLITDLPEEADVILVNTCAVREHAELKTLSITGQFKHLKEKKPTLLIGLCGCMVSQEYRSDEIKKRYPYVDFVFGTGKLYCFPEILQTALGHGKRCFYRNEDDGNLAEGLPVRRASKFKAWVSIMYGCNNFCTYCIVPYVRGRERSRLPADILKEVQTLADEGYREITLLGQNVNSYGKDLDVPYDFADLIADICRIEGDFIVRFMTSHPKDVPHKLIDVIAVNPKVARAFHLPLQAGSDRILREMNRHYTKQQYLDTVAELRRKVPDISLTTDIMVGFPGETEEDFEETLSMLRTVEFDNIYSFLYSPRRGTRAAEMTDQVPESVKSARFDRMMTLQSEISRRRNLAYEGKISRVLVEGRSKTDASRLTGRNEKNRLVHFSGDDSLIGNWADVLVTRAETYALFGELPKQKDAE